MVLKKLDLTQYKTTYTGKPEQTKRVQ